MWIYGEMALTAFIAYDIVFLVPYIDLLRNLDDIATLSSYDGSRYSVTSAGSGVRETNLIVYFSVPAVSAGLALAIYGCGAMTRRGGTMVPGRWSARSLTFLLVRLPLAQESTPARPGLACDSCDLNEREYSMTDSTGPGPIRLGLIGTGLATEILHWPAIRQLPDLFQVVAFANRTRPKAEHFASYAGMSMDDYAEDYHDLLARSDVEAVLISLPIPLNLPVTKAALEAGKHVICEKPAGANEGEARAFIELEKQYPDKVVLLTENCFYRDDARLARSLIDDGAIGRIHLLSWRVVSQLVPKEGTFSSTPWRHHPGYVGGPHIDAGVHHTALIRLLAGDAERVYGEIQDANSTHGGPSDLVMTLRFVSGAIGNYTAGYPELAVPTDGNALRIYGTEGVITLGHRSFTLDRPDEGTVTHTTGQTDGGHLNAFINFGEAVRSGAGVVGTVTQTWRNMQIVLDAFKAADLGQAVSLDPFPDALTAKGIDLWRPIRTDPVFDDASYVTKTNAGDS
jgi:predicted dehydrogenase